MQILVNIGSSVCGGNNGKGSNAFQELLLGHSSTDHPLYPLHPNIIRQFFLCRLMCIVMLSGELATLFTQIYRVFQHKWHKIRDAISYELFVL